MLTMGGDAPRSRSARPRLRRRLWRRRDDADLNSREFGAILIVDRRRRRRKRRRRRRRRATRRRRRVSLARRVPRSRGRRPVGRARARRRERQQLTQLDADFADSCVRSSPTSNNRRRVHRDDARHSRPVASRAAPRTCSRARTRLRACQGASRHRGPTERLQSEEETKVVGPAMRPAPLEVVRMNRTRPEEAALPSRE